MKLMCLIALFGTLAGAAVAEDSVLSLCNHNTDRAVFTAHMRQVGGGAGWQSNGWYKVAAGQCLDLNLGKYVGSAYLFAQDEFQESSWGEGSVQFCVNATKGFSLNNADVIACTEAQQKKVHSDLISILPGKTTWDIQPNFSQVSLCNRNSDFSLYAALARPVDGDLTSKGWYQVAGGQCRVVTLGKYSGPVSYYASGNQLAWEGDATPFCVHGTQGFEIKGADQAANCLATGMEQVHPRTATVGVGLTTLDFEPKTLATTLVLCNSTNKILMASRALLSPDGRWAAAGWDRIEPQKCVEHGLTDYSGKVQVYAEWNQGEMYWGNGPFEFCVHRTEDFALPDSANSAQCNSDILLKRVPSFEMTVKPGVNTFTFQP